MPEYTMTESSCPEHTPVEKLLAKHVAQISEHVQSVQIIVTVQNGKETTRYVSGTGCWYSRMGVLRELVLNDNAEIADRVRRLNANIEEE